MRYFIGFLVVIALVVGVFLLVLRGFSGRDQAPKNEITLTDYAGSETVVSMTVEGRVLADQNHYSYRVVVGRDANTIEVRQGYENKVTTARTYPNNSEAYADFLRALQLQGFTKGDSNKDNRDSRGFCPNGQRVIYQIETAGQEVQYFWTSTCGGGTFRGNSETIRPLFGRQIPDFDTIVNRVRL